MNEILNIAVLIVLVAAFAGLVAWVRRDTFTGEQYRTPALPEKSPTHPKPATSAGSLYADVLPVGLLHIN